MPWIETLCAFSLLVVLVNALWPRRRADAEVTVNDESMTTVELKVAGMHCNGCVQSVKRALLEVAGVSEAEVWLEEGLARVKGNGFSTELLLSAVTALGFTAES
jgi:copper chaperone